MTKKEGFNQEKFNKMKNLKIRILINTLALLLISHALFAQKPERVDFAKAGSPALVWEQKIKANGSKDFIFAAKKGQKLTLGFIDDTNEGTMDLGKVSIEPNADEPFTMTIDVTKDYSFRVTNNSNKATSFRIFITLDNPKKAAPAKKATTTIPTNNKVNVQFAKGKSDATLTRTIAAEGSVEFIIHAKKGQKMDFTVGYDFKDSDVEVYLQEPELKNEISLSTGPKSPNEFSVVKSGNHSLFVMNTTKKKITITLYLSIQ